MIMLLLLKSAIIPNPITVSPDTTVAEALKQMVAPTSKHPDDVDPPQSGYAKIWADCVVVLEQGRFLGIVTAQEWWPCHLVPGPTADFGDPGPKAVPPALDQVLVRDVMVSPGAEIRWSEGNDMATLLALFQQSGSHYLPVLGKADEFLGMVSRDSLGYAALQHLALQATEPQHSHQQQDGSMAHPGEEELRANSDFSMPPSHCRFAWANSGTHSNGAANAANHSTTHGADGLTLALEQQFNARITELEARVNWEKVLTDLAAQICSSLDLQTILDITVQQVQQVLGCDRITIWQFETEDCAIAVAEALGCTGVSFLGERIETTGLHPASEKASPDIHITQFSAYYPDALVHLQSQDKLLVPLFCGDSLWGLLQVNGRQVAQPWADKDVDLLQFLSMQLAIALQHATTHQQLQKELDERRQAQIQQQETAQALQKLNQTLEAKVAERTLALQERESRYRALIEVMPDLMIRIHADGTYLDVVLGQETLPFNPEQFRPGVNIYDVTPADHARTRMEYVHRALDTHIVQFYEYELDIQGKIMIEEARIIAINAEEALVIARDITERKRTENQLRQSEQRFRQAIASAPFPIMIHAEDGEVLQINEVWTELTGYTHADMPTTQVWAERAYGDRATEVLETIINPKYGINHRHDAVELTVTTRDGQARIWHVSSTHLGQLADGRHLVMSMAADITQHRQAELALQESETRWQFALEGSGDGIWDWNAQTNTVFFSRQWKTMLGFTDAEIGSDLQEWDSRMHPDDRDQCYADLNRHFRGETPVYQNEHRLRCKDGSYKWILDRGKVIEWFDDGQPLRVIGTHTDISDRKRAEAQLQNLIAGTAATTGHDFFPVLVQHLAEALEVAYAVIAALDDGQLHPLAFWGRGDLQLVCSYETHQTPCDRSLQEGMYHCESGVQQAFPLDHDLVFLNADSYFGIALHNSQGELIGNLCILDVQPIRSPQRAKQILQVFAARAAAEMERQRARTDLEKLNQALESKVIERTAKLLERETRYRGLMEGAGDGILVCDRHGKVLEVNHKAVELLGYGRDELEGMSFQDLCPPGDCSAMMTQFDQIAAQPSFHGEDSQFVAKGGRCIPVDISTSVLEIQEKLIIQAIFRDISDRKRAEAILQQTNAELMRATRLKDEFLANMSHELRTPLNAILGMTEGLQDGVFGPLNPKQIEALQTVERGGQHLLQLINDVLDVAKIEAGHMALDLAPTAIAPLCRSSLNFVKQQALKKRIQIDTHLPSHLPDVNLDERRIRQVLINLLNNAVKFTPEGGRITLAVRLEKTENRRPKAEEFPTLHIAITDTGIGIAPDHLNRLFQPFVQIDGALNRQYTGTGLGLALVKRIVELHRGTVTLRSEVGVGSCFTLSLPYDETIPLLRIQTATPELVEQPAAPDQIAPTILIVEDNDANVRTMSSYLQARGYHIHVAYNGQDALNFLQKHQPDLILMDIQMPEMDGLEAIQYIRHHQATANIPIIALTALAMEGDRDRCLAAGANEYLSKPVKLRLLASTIQQHLLHGNERTDHHDEPR